MHAAHSQLCTLTGELYAEHCVIVRPCVAIDASKEQQIRTQQLERPPIHTYTYIRIYTHTSGARTQPGKRATHTHARIYMGVQVLVRASTFDIGSVAIGNLGSVGGSVTATTSGPGSVDVFTVRICVCACYLLDRAGVERATRVRVSDNSHKATTI